MLPQKRTLSRLLGSLYDAVGNLDLWDVFLRDFAQATLGDSAALMMHDLRANQHNVTQQFGLDPDVLRATYTLQGQIDDIWVESARSLSHTGWVGVSAQFSTQTELLRSAFYNECLRNLKIHHGMFGVTQQDGSTLAGIALYRPINRPAFGASDLQLLQFLLPHLRRALQLHFRLAGVLQKSAVLEEAIDMVPSAIFFFDAAGKILLMNRSALTLLAQRDGLIATRNELSAEQLGESANLKELVLQASATSMAKGLDAGGGMLISRKSRRPLQLLVSPLRNLKVGIPKAAAAVALVVDPTQRIRPRNDILRALFGMTPAECRVAHLLGDGKSLNEISAEIGVTRNTLKTQTASIYAKTSTSRQAQLVRLFLQFPLVGSRIQK